MSAPTNDPKDSPVEDRQPETPQNNVEPATEQSEKKPHSIFRGHTDKPNRYNNQQHPNRRGGYRKGDENRHHNSAYQPNHGNYHPRGRGGSHNRTNSNTNRYAYNYNQQMYGGMPGTAPPMMMPPHMGGPPMMSYYNHPASPVTVERPTAQKSLMITDANGNQIDIREMAKSRKNQDTADSSEGSAPSSAGSAVPAEFVKADSSKSEAAMAFRLKIEERRRQKAAEKAAQDAAARGEEPPKTPAEEPKKEPVEEVKQEVKQEVQEEPKPAVEEPKQETPKEEPQETQTQSQPEEPKRAPFIPIHRRKQMAAEAAAAAGQPAPEEEAPKEAPKEAAPEKSETAEAVEAEAPKVSETPETPKIPETSEIPEPAPKDGPSPSSTLNTIPEQAAINEPPRPAADQVFMERVRAAHRATVEEQAELEYPSNFFRNDELKNAEGNKFRYGRTFLLQFKNLVPKVDHIATLKKIGIDPLNMNNWMNSSGRNMSHRNSSRGQGNFSSRGSTRGPRSKTGSKRSKGGRRDRDEHNRPPPADLPPLQTAEKAWVPSFKQKSSTEEDDGLMSEEEVKKQVLSLLNKMAWENFDTIASKLKNIIMQSAKENDGKTLVQVAKLTIDKAADEPHWSRIYANFFYYLHVVSPIPEEIVDSSDPAKPRKGLTVLRHYVLGRCQGEFEKGWVSLPEPTNGDALTDEYYKAATEKRRGLGLIKFIGEMFKLGILSEKLLAQCFARLSSENPTEDIVESYCQLLMTVGPTLEAKFGRSSFQSALDTLADWRTSGGLAARLRFMIMDLEDIVAKNWDDPKLNTGPKTIAEVHMEARAKEVAEAKAKQAAKGKEKGGFGFQKFRNGRRN